MRSSCRVIADLGGGDHETFWDELGIPISHLQFHSVRSTSIYNDRSINIRVLYCTMYIRILSNILISSKGYTVFLFSRVCAVAGRE